MSSIQGPGSSSATLIITLDKEAKDKLNWDQIVFVEWKRLATKAKHPVASLKYVLRWAIDNDETIAVIDALYEKKGIKDAKKQEGEWVPWLPGTEDFLALLGTKNAAGAAYLLIDFPVSLGKKTVKRILTRKVLGKWAMLIEYGS